MVVHHQGPSLVIHTPAKLNLFLKILGKRPDGYHSLETVMVSVGLYDSLIFREAASNQTHLNCHRCESRHAFCGGAYPDLPAGPDNLVARAERLLRIHTGCEQGVQIDLIKRIPMQAGMGGGSSDAAATLVGLNRLWRLGLGTETLHELAAQLGSDVNFFLESPLAAICRGRGERVEPIRLPKRLTMVVACPNRGLSTPDVFRQWSSTASAPLDVGEYVERLQRGILSPEEGVYNMLEAPAIELSNDVSSTLASLRRVTRRPVGMSGSGTACFAVCQSGREARSIAGTIALRGFAKRLCRQQSSLKETQVRQTTKR